MTLVNIITDRLADQVVRDRVGRQAMLGEDFPASGAITIVADGLAHLEVVAPAGELDAIVAKLVGLLAHGLKGQVCPLSCKKRNWAWHG